ncbi:L-Aspartase-like family protein [Zea mays]|uniref:Adenylosuccinate lyase n=1 Tax=Zea mays TaxID=4577 RepID=A0A1D6PBU4_MAIZE|nr:L-Aspartase-like family protein [Zea mays]
MSAPPSLKTPATAVAVSRRSVATPRATGLRGACAPPTRRLRCSASAAVAGASTEMADAPLDWAERSLEELHSLPDHDTFCLMALSPLDGRYDRFVKELMPFFSEFGLIRYRVLIEIKWLLKLSQIPEITEVPQFSKEAQSLLNAIIENFCIDDAKEVKKIEKVTNHDVKAVEYFLKQRCSSNPEIAKVSEFFHFGCTSEDINNLSHALALKEGVNKVMFPAMIDLCRAMCSLATQNSGYPMLARTHGQPASPTTVGKEMANFAARLSDIGKSFSEVKILGKFAGAVGNYNADVVAYPEVDWPKVAEEFVRSLGLQFNPYVTQIEPHDYISKLFNLFTQFNNVLTDFDRDMWSYISLGYFKQIPKAGEVGSSTMPHKINPIDFENSDGNLCQANSILSGISMKLPISRLQRDLTDSTVLRNLGMGLGHSLLAYKATMRGISKVQVGDPELVLCLVTDDILNESRLAEDLEQTWEVLAEPIQTVMRRYGIPEPYEKLKELTRGQAVTKDSMQQFINGLDIPEEVRSKLSKLTPHSYTGLAEDLARDIEKWVDLESGFQIK